jgi:predicted esterase
MSDKGRFNPYRSKPELPWVRNLWCALGLVLLIVGWRWVVYAGTKSLKKEGREMVQITRLYNNPVPNHAGDKLLYMKNTETGLGVYLKNLSTGKTQTIQEIPETRVLGSFYLLEWSPDDSILAYTQPRTGQKQEVVLCSGSTGKPFAKIAAQGIIDEFRWLTTNSFAYVNEAKNVFVATRKAQGIWGKPRQFKKTVASPITRLEAISPKKLGWIQDNIIWTWEPSKKKLTQIWKSEDGKLLYYSYSRENEKFLITTLNKDKGYQIWSMGIDSTTPELLETTQSKIAQPKWINNGQGYAYRCADHWADSLILRRDLSASPVSLFSEGQIVDYRPNSDQIFIHGSEKDGPRGIWEYDIRTGSQRCVVSPMEQPFSFEGKVTHVCGVITNQSREIPYHLWRPANLKPGKKYPLILGQTRYDWNPYPQIAARSGFYFVMVTRKSWARMEDWDKDIMAIYDDLNDPHIDKKRIYLYGHSAETSLVSNIASEKPDLWKGVLLFSPTTLPDLSRSHISTMLIAAGKNDEGNGKRLPEYQANAAKAGVDVHIVMNPEAMHTAYSKSSEQERVDVLATYLSSQN